MQSLFKGYYSLDDAEMKDLWARGIFVLDASVLLNLYRYPESARTELLELLRSVQSRLWVPYHAALEYHRNRLSVISAQKRRFHEVKELAQKTLSSFTGEMNKLQLVERHALINPKRVLEDVEAAIKQFISEVDELSLKHMDVDKPDTIRAELSKLLDGRVGEMPDQGYVDRIVKEGAARFSARIPPGYMDADKAKSAEPAFSYGGVKYERQFGDLIVWNQILDFARDTNATHLMFITDDDKEDWWSKVNSAGAKTMGPRPEIVEEAVRLGKLRAFHMAKPSTFMFQSKLYLQSSVSDDTIEQVEAVSRASRPRVSASSVDSDSALSDWLSEQHPGWVINETILPDFTLISPNQQEQIGVEIIRPSIGSSIPDEYAERVSDLSDPFLSEKLSKLYVVAVTANAEESARQAEKLVSMTCDPKYGFILGHLEYTSGRPRFVVSLRLSA